MSKGGPAAPSAAAGPAARRYRRVSSAILVAVGCAVLAMVAAEWPLAALARQSPVASSAGAPFWLFSPFAVVGFVVAWWRPRNPLGWILVGLAVAGGLSEDGGLYAIADYRLRHGTLPLGWVAVLAQPAWAPGVVLIGLAVLLFPDGRLASPRLRVVLWPYLALGLLWMLSAYAITADVIVRHHISVDSAGNLVALDNGSHSPAWWNALQNVVFFLLAASWLLTLAGQAASYRGSSGERRQQLKWLLASFAACLAGLALKIALGDAAGFWGAVGDVALLAIFAPPVAMGVAIMKYRLYDIDRIISRTLAYAIITGLLIGVYAGLVLLATQVLGFHTPVAVAAATLAAAALFTPVRRRVQRAVDRRFNRARYDAEDTVAAFAARLKDEVDLDAVREDLAGVVEAALEPAHVAVWISPRP